MQISAICESSAVVSSSGARFASSRSAMRVISRPFQTRRAAKFSAAIESPATVAKLVEHFCIAARRETYFRLTKPKKSFGIPHQSRRANAGDCQKMKQRSFAQWKLFDDINKWRRGGAATVRQVGRGSFRPVRD